MADLFVRIDELAGYVTALFTIAADASHAQESGNAGLAQYADSWGQDAPGAAFAGAYVGPATDTLDCLQQLPVQLTALGAAMLVTSESYSGTETGNTQLAKGATS